MGCGRLLGWQGAHCLSMYLPPLLYEKVACWAQSLGTSTAGYQHHVKENKSFISEEQKVRARRNACGPQKLKQ